MAWHLQQLAMKKKGNKKKEITCYKCGKSGHYSHKCDKVTTVKTSNTNSTGKQGSNFLVLKEDEDYSSSEDEPRYVPTFDQKEFEEPKKYNDDKYEHNDDHENEHEELEEQWPNEENDKDD